MINVFIQLEEEEHRKTKSISASKGMLLKEYIIEAIKEKNSSSALAENGVKNE